MCINSDQTNFMSSYDVIIVRSHKSKQLVEIILKNLYSNQNLKSTKDVCTYSTETTRTGVMPWCITYTS